MSEISPLIRAALIVSDLDASHAFYRDVLGLDKVHFEGDLSTGNAHRLLGVGEDATVRARILKAQDPAIGMVGLFQVDDESMPPPRNPTTSVQVGDVALVMNCADLDPVRVALEDRGAQIICGPLRLETSLFKGAREMMFLDPDGTKINLIERPVPTVHVTDE